MGYRSTYHSILTEMEANQTTNVASTELIATSSCPKCYVHLRNYTRYIFSWLTTCYLDDSHWQNFLTHSEGKRNLNFQYGIINDCKIQQKLKFTYEFSNNLHGRNENTALQEQTSHSFSWIEHVSTTSSVGYFRVECERVLTAGVRYWTGFESRTRTVEVYITLPGFVALISDTTALKLKVKKSLM